MMHFLSLFLLLPQAGTAPTIRPIPQEESWWHERHLNVKELARTSEADLIFIGDSITQGWEGNGKEVWEQYYAPRGAINLGFSGDRTEHVAWRLMNGNLGTLDPKLAVIMIGTNNSGRDSPADIALGVEYIVELLRYAKPEMKILLLAIFPRGVDRTAPQRIVNNGANKRIAKLATDPAVHFLDIGSEFLAQDGTLSTEIMPDRLHLSPKGYEIWASACEPKIAKLLGVAEREPVIIEPKVLIIGIDGCRPDTIARAKTRALDKLAIDGSLSLNAQTCGRTSSGPSWSSLLTGAWPKKHGVRDNSFEGADFERFPHLFQRIEEQDPQHVTASVSSWAPIEEHIVSGIDVSQTCEDDDCVVEKAEELLASPHLDALFLHFDSLDKAGHSYGYGPNVPEYVAALEAVDKRIARVTKALHARPSFEREDWLVLVTTDHGGLGKEHGQSIPEHRTIFVLASGPSAVRGGLYPTPVIVDVGVTALAHLGIPIDPAWELDGRVIGLR